MSKINFHFHMQTGIIVLLKNTCYIEMWQGTREVEVLSLDQVKEKFNCPDGPDSEKFKKANLLAVKMIAGIYVGDRNDQEGNLKVIKVKPYCGLMHPDAEYLVIPPDVIKSINEYKLKERS